MFIAMRIAGIFLIVCGTLCGWNGFSKTSAPWSEHMADWELQTALEQKTAAEAIFDFMQTLKGKEQAAYGNVQEARTRVKTAASAYTSMRKKREFAMRALFFAASVLVVSGLILLILAARKKSLMPNL